MAQIPSNITIDIQTIPEVRELLASVWNEGYIAGRTTDRVANPYREGSN